MGTLSSTAASLESDIRQAIADRVTQVKAELIAKFRDEFDSELQKAAAAITINVDRYFNVIEQSDVVRVELARRMG